MTLAMRTMSDMQCSHLASGRETVLDESMFPLRWQRQTANVLLLIGVSV
jgi:hypothetical protein